MNLTLTSPLSLGSHQFYANTSNIYGTSGCSSPVSYTYVLCPAGYVHVPRNTAVGTNSDFCVMKYEAKNNGSGTAVSQAAGDPYVSLTIGASQTKCTNLGANYNLISNPEWMTIARNAENVGSNWSNGTVGYGQMARGWAAHTSTGDSWLNSAVAPSTNSNCLYNTGSNTCASSGTHVYKRTLTLSNGDEIWDFSGHVWEWVDWNLTTPGLQLGPKTCSASFVDFSVAANYSCLIGLENQVFPATPNVTYVEALGSFFGGTGGAAIRGGVWGSGSTSGAFALSLGLNESHSYSNIGFRCVYRP